MNIFGRPRNAAASAAPKAKSPPDMSSAIMKLRHTCETLEKRESHIQTKVKQQLLEAKAKMKKGDKKGALFCMKRKNMYQNEIDKILGARNTLETQAIALENSAMNMQTFQAMQEGRNAMRDARGKMDADNVADTIDDIKDEIDESDAISSALGAPLDDTLEDDETLLAELTEMEQLELEESLMNIPQANARNPTRVDAELSGFDLPDAPTSAVQVDDADAEELAALRELEASMMAA
uniref:Charged multivesicular body protein 4b n=1 Tax=Octactis speculum TaxID=3111310 RepID=A0A7S2ATB5_9STRA|mmetsp:Transcript_15302/g.20528  ORF Transcript_15302/g.20528 Transcript_15302/m.20528 type:complete len:237 (+) Transcript_15302:21-731(+)